MATELVSCPACGRKNASDRTICVACNANLTPETGDSIKGAETTSDPTLANPHPTQNVKAPTVNWFKAGTLFALCLIASSCLLFVLPQSKMSTKGSSLLLTFRDFARYYLPHVPSPAD